MDNHQENLNSTDILVSSLINHFNDNKQGFTSYRFLIDKILKENIKPLTKGKSNIKTDSGWRSDLMERFSGRGAKWVFVSLQDIEPTLKSLEDSGINCDFYRKHINIIGKAWIRFIGPRINNGVNSASFEVRTEGSTIISSNQVHYIPVESLDDTIEMLNTTPKSLKLEEDSAPMPKTSKPKKKSPKPKKQNLLETLGNEINEELQEVELNIPPQNDDPDDWEAFLASEGLIDDDFMNDDI